MSAVVRFSDLTLGYDRHPAVHHLDGEIARGALTAVIGPNGAGKSTLLKGLVGLVEPLGGRIELVGIDRRDIAHLPQAAEVARGFPMSVFDFVGMGAWRRVGPFGAISRREVAAIDEALDAVGLDGFETRPIGTLSGGQTQRMLFARLLVQDAAVILLDEPFNAVDARTVEDLLAIVKRWHGEGRTVIAVLHDLDLVLRHFREALLLAREPVAAGPVEAVVRPDMLARARAMIEAFDVGAHPCGRDGRSGRAA